MIQHNPRFHLVFHLLCYKDTYSYTANLQSPTRRYCVFKRCNSLSASGRPEHIKDFSIPSLTNVTLQLNACLPATIIVTGTSPVSRVITLLTVD